MACPPATMTLARNVDYYFNNAWFQSAPVEIFYAATGHTHPVGNTKFCASDSSSAMIHQQNDYLLSSDPFTTATPNWFHYYSQAWPSPVPIAYDDEGIGNHQSYYNHGDANHPGDDHVHISQDAHGEYNTRLYNVQNGKLQYTGQTRRTWGLDNFASTIAHEAAHKWIHDSFKASVAAAQGMNNGIPDKLVDAQGNEILDENGRWQAVDPDADPDGDRLPTGFEISLGLDPTNPDSTGTNSGGDEDIYSQMQEINVNTDRSKDWADDGLNHGTVPGPDPDNRHLIKP